MIDSAVDYKTAIAQLETKQLEEVKQLRQQFHMTYESLKPINLLKSTFSEVVETKDLSTNILNTGVGLAAGYLSKILFVGFSNSPVKKLLGNILLLGITNLVARHPELVKSIGAGAFKIAKNLAAGKGLKK